MRCARGCRYSASVGMGRTSFVGRHGHDGGVFEVPRCRRLHRVVLVPGDVLRRRVRRFGAGTDT